MKNLIFSYDILFRFSRKFLLIESKVGVYSPLFLFIYWSL
jgi:hypothetical protein